MAAELAQFFLRTEGYDVHLAPAAGGAEEQWLESRPQLAIVELMISGGVGAVPATEAAPCWGRTRALRPAGSRRDEALAAGADAFLQKPVDPPELV